MNSHGPAIPARPVPGDTGRRRRIVFAGNSLRLGGSQTVLLELVHIAVGAGYEVVVASRGGQLDRQVRTAGARTIRVVTREGSAGTHGSPGAVARTAASLIGLTQLTALSRPPGTLVQASQPWPTGLAAGAALATGSPLIWLAHGTTSVEVPPAFPGLVRRASKAWVGISPEVVTELEHLSAGGPEVVHIPNPLTLRFDPAECARPVSGVIGVVSTLTANKRVFVESCLEAVAELAGLGRPSWVLVVGSGPEQAALERLADRLVRTRPHLSVRFLGATPRPWVELATCDLVVGMGMVALEAAVRGHNVVCASSEGVGGHLTVASFPTLSATNFTGRGIAAPSKSLLATTFRSALRTGADATLGSAVAVEHGTRSAALWTDLWNRLGR